jgi:hypothetical protein
MAWALLSTNPDQRCAIRDDRNSFIRSKNSLPNPELDDLGLSARQAKGEDVPEVPKLAERPNTAGRDVELRELESAEAKGSEESTEQRAVEGTKRRSSL